MVKTQAVWNEREQRTLVVSTLQDITELKRTEQAQHILAEASRLLAASLDYSSGLASLVRELGFRSEMVVPLLARERALGAITFVRTRSQTYAPADLALAEELAQRVAIAVDNGG